MITASDQYKDSQVSQAALKVSLGGLLSLVLGLAVQVLTAYLFGAGKEMDAFFTASTIPVYFQLVLLTGLPFVVIPAFIHEEAAGRKSEAWGLASSFLYLTSGILILLSIIGVFFSSQIIALVAPGFGTDKSELASRMLAIMTFTTPFVGIGYITAGVQNARNHFFGPAAAVAVGSAANLLVLLFFHSWTGAISLAWGALAAAIFQAIITAVPFFKHGWNATISLRDPRLHELVRLIAPFIFFGIFTCSRSLLERFFASQLPNGQLSYIGYANKVANIFVVLLATSIASAIFPAMAHEFLQGGKPGLIKRTDHGLRLTLAVAFPVVILISVCAIPFVSVLYERGAFLHSMTINVALIIPFILLNEVLFRMLNNILSRAFYIFKDTLLVNLIQSITIILYIWAANVLTAQWGFVGLAVAALAQSGPAIIILALVLYWRMKSFPITEFFKKLFLYIIASIIAGLTSWAAINLLSKLPVIIQLASSLVVGGLVYLCILKLLDTEIAHDVLEMSGILKIVKFFR